MNWQYARRDLLIKVLEAFDIALVSLCLIWAVFDSYSVRNHVPLGDFLGMRIKVQNFILFAIWMLCWNWLLSHFGAYESRRLSTSRVAEYRALLKATALGTVLIAVTDLILPIEVITLRSMLFFWMTVSLALIASRLVLHLLQRKLRRNDRNLNHLLIVGTNERAAKIARRIKMSPDMGYHLVGFVDEPWAQSGYVNESERNIVCDFSGFAKFINENVVDEVLICLPVRSLHERSSRILSQCEEQGITVRFVSDVYALKNRRYHQDQFDDQIVVTVDGSNMRGPAVLIKRFLDLGISSALLIIIAPVLLAIAVAIRMDSPGPALFLQERMGLNKRRFLLIKFRTMVDGAERRIAELENRNEASGPVFKIKKDPRVTRLGAFLRRTSLDELPQLLNVLRGDMSLVGPRPLPVRDYQGFSKDWHRRRFSVRPGITCLWQVLGRSSIPFERWMELDMQYIDEWSLVLDLRILIQTIPAVLRGSGAH